jgi:hypothetical protein
MKMYGIDLAEGSEIANSVIASGTTLPGSPDIGELFYLNAGAPASDGLYVYNNAAAWQKLSLPSSSTVTFRHTQTTPSATWNIVHNLGTTAIQITTYIDDGGGTFAKIIPQNERILNANTVEVNFSTTFAGQVVLIGFPT